MEKLVYLVAYDDADGPYAAAFSTQELAEAFAATFDKAPDSFVAPQAIVIAAQVDACVDLIAGIKGREG